MRSSIVDDAPGAYALRVRELLSGLATETEVTIQSPAKGAATDNQVHMPETESLRLFGLRDCPLAIALTPEQKQNAAMMTLAKQLKIHYEMMGRQVRIATVELGDAVTSIQSIDQAQHRPQWHGRMEDLVLLGSPQTNVLLYDQAKGRLLPAEA